jgi:hypothetical protein
MNRTTLKTSDPHFFINLSVVTGAVVVLAGWLLPLDGLDYATTDSTTAPQPAITAPSIEKSINREPAKLLLEKPAVIKISHEKETSSSIHPL